MFLGVFNDLITNDEANATAQAFFRNKLRQVVDDPVTAKKLMPDFNVGCKRQALTCVILLWAIVEYLITMHTKGILYGWH